MDWFGSLETVAALGPGKGFGPFVGWITILSRVTELLQSQGAASEAAAAFVSTDSARVFAGWRSAGVVVEFVGRHVSLDCVGKRSTSDLDICGDAGESEGCLGCKLLKGYLSRLESPPTCRIHIFHARPASCDQGRGRTKRSCRAE